MSDAFLYQLRENEKSKKNIESTIPTNFDMHYKNFKKVNYTDNDHDSTKNIVPFIKTKPEFSNVYSFMHIPLKNNTDPISLGKEFCFDQYYSIDKIVPVYLNTLPDAYYQFNLKGKTYEQLRLDKARNQEGIETMSSKLVENSETGVAMDQLDRDRETFKNDSSIFLEQLRSSMSVQPPFEKIEEKVQYNIAKNKSQRENKQTDEDLEIENSEIKKDMTSLANMMNNKLFNDSSPSKLKKTEKTEKLEKGENKEDLEDEESIKKYTNMKIFNDDEDMDGLSEMEIEFKKDFNYHLKNYVTKEDKNSLLSRIKLGGNSLIYTKKDVDMRGYVSRLLKNIHQKQNRDIKTFGTLDPKSYSKIEKEDTISASSTFEYKDDENTRLY